MTGLRDEARFLKEESCSCYEKSAFQALIAARLPAVDQVPLLSAPGGLTGSRKVHVNMCCAVSYGILQFFVPFQPLVHIARLRDVERNPLPVFRLSSVDVIAWQRAERSVERKDFVLILSSGLAWPANRWSSRTLLLVATTQQTLYEVHLINMKPP